LLLGMLNVLGLDVVYALAGGTVAAALLFHPYIKDQNHTMSLGAVNSVVPLINTSAVVGFGAVVAAVPGFQLLTTALMGAPWHPFISVSLVTAIISSITGSASGGLAIVMETMSQSFLATGLSPEAIHRLAVMSCTAVVLPSNGITITILGLSGLSHREGYWQVVKLYVFGQLAALAAGLVVAMLAY
jgi:H+/gluconate symporter-like permease